MPQVRGLKITNTVRSFLEERMRSLAAGSHWGANYFPDVPVVTQDGKTLKFYADVVDASACFRR